MRRSWRLVAAVLALLLPGVSTATEFGYGLGYSATHSNNITLSNTNPQADWLSIAKGQLALEEDGLRNFGARVYSQLEYDHYQHQIFSNQTMFTLNSAATWAMRPRVLSWTAEDYYGQVPIVPFASVTPSNMQSVNVLTTGPTALARIDPLNTLELGMRYDNFHSSVANNDSYRVGGFAGWLYQYSPVTVFSLNYHGQNARYMQNVLASGYDRQDMFLRMDTRFPTTAWVVDLGDTWLHQSVLGRVSGLYARLLMSRQITKDTALSVTAISTITDVEDQVLSAESTSGIVGGSSVGTDIYRQDSVDAAYSVAGPLGMDSVDLFDQKLKYYTSPLSQEQAGVGVQFGYQFSGTLLGSLFGGYSRTRFYDNSVINRDGNEGVGLTYEARPSIFVGLKGQISRQQSTSAANSYTEKQIVLSVSYYSNFTFVNAGTVVPPLTEQDNITRDIMYGR